MGIELTTRLVPIPGIPQLIPLSPLGLLAPLAGTWDGHGFNQIFRPLQQQLGSDNFLELNLTNETLEFTEIPGEIPNRGFAQQDISLFGLTYLQQVADANVTDTHGNPAGIHIEPGIWINIPSTTNPQEPATVARLANIPHGTSLLAQGSATVVAGPPVFPAVDITPSFIGQPNNKVPFGSQNLSIPSPFRSPPSDIVGITQAMVDNPNSVLQDSLAGKTINSTTVIRISTLANTNTAPDAGGGVSDIAFLNGTGSPNVEVIQMDATFWISNFTDATGSGTLLQYSQLVLLNFAPLTWPHVSVASLVKRVTKVAFKDLKDNKVELKEHKPELKIEIKEHKPEIKDHKPELKIEVKEHKPEFKELESLPQVVPQPDPGRAGHAAAAPAEGRHFIAPVERPAVEAPPLPEAPLAAVKKVAKTVAKKTPAKKRPPRPEVLVVLASRYDTAAASLVERWHEDDARLLTCEDLSQPGWHWEPDRPSTATLPLDGDVVPLEEVTGALSLLGGVDCSELPHIAPDESEYVAGEMMAFLVAWLTALPCRVLNRPTPLCLTGPRLHHEQWLGAAVKAGLPVLPSTRRVPRFAPGAAGSTAPTITYDTRELDGGSVVTFSLVAGPVVPGPKGSPTQAETEQGLGRLASTVGAGLLTATFIERDGTHRFAGASPTVDATLPDVADAMRAELRAVS